VVPANDSDWSHDPVAGELIDGTVWRRGAIDMLNLTATMARPFVILPGPGSGPGVTSPMWPWPTKKRLAPMEPSG
jgi:hypothetical protein